MNTLRKLGCWVLMIGFAAFAMPGHAAQSQNKTYTLLMCVGTLDSSGNCAASLPGPGGVVTTVQARLVNTSPKQSSSTFSSVDLFANLNWSIHSVDSVYVTSQGVNVQFPATFSGGHITIPNVGPIKPGDSLNVTFSVDGFSCGDGSWAGSLIWSGSNFGGNLFTMDAAPVSTPVTSVACGSVACNGLVTAQPSSNYCFNTGGDGVECVSGNRGPYNKNGSCSSSVPAYISTYLGNSTSKQKVHFRWPAPDPTSTVNTGVFTYTINTPAPAPTSPTPNPSPADFAWIEDAGGNPIPVPSLQLQCNTSPAFLTTPAFLATPLPQPVGTLAADVNSSKKILSITAADPSVTAPPAFSIVIGTEMMQVTKISNGNWTVTRGFGNTTPAPHGANDSVMYSPLPIIPNAEPFNSTSTPGYAPGNHARMCWTAYGLNTDGTNFTDVVDIGDAWVLGK